MVNKATKTLWLFQSTARDLKSHAFSISKMESLLSGFGISAADNLGYKVVLMIHVSWSEPSIIGANFKSKVKKDVSLQYATPKVLYELKGHTVQRSH